MRSEQWHSGRWNTQLTTQARLAFDFPAGLGLLNTTLIEALLKLLVP